MGPPGWKKIVHNNPVKRGSWAFHGVPGFYIGLFMNGYCKYKIYIPNNRADQSTDTVVFFPQSTKMPFMSTIDAIKK